jgi:hypothetical protein
MQASLRAPRTISASDDGLCARRYALPGFGKSLLRTEGIFNVCTDCADKTALAVFMTGCPVLRRCYCVMSKTMPRVGIRARLRRLQHFITNRPSSTASTAQSRPEKSVAHLARDQLDSKTSGSPQQRVETIIPETPWQRHKSER